MRVGLVRVVVCLGATLAAMGCLERELTELNPCLTATLDRTVRVQNIDKVDLLFVVDDSTSMRDEQAALRREFPKLIRTLTTGVREDGTTFTPVRDLHLGVVSTDIGTGGQPQAWNEACTGSGGDGVLQSLPDPRRDPALAGMCPTDVDTWPAFLSFVPERDDPEQVARAFQCVASLGTEGCGFEQQLEAMLKAITPAVLPGTDPSDPQIIFRSGDGQLVPGHGDGLNAGFLRNGQGSERSLLAIVLVTDEEDCSSDDTSHFNLTDGDTQHELRCFRNSEHLYPIRDRYFDALRALRPEKNLLIFAAIVGVPEDLVDEAARAAVRWEDEASVAAYYDAILDDPRMQERINAEGDRLEPSCTNRVGEELQAAYPPRRIVELAKHFGENAVVQSICQDSFARAIDALIDAIARNVGNVCLPRTLVPNSEGLIEGCEIVWELPVQPSPGTITRCDERAYLTAREGIDGAAQCIVAQVPVRDGAPLPGVEGWYYDDFSSELGELCRDQPRRIAFTEPPPSGVTVKLECGRDFAVPPHDPSVSARHEQPTVGSDCRGAGGAPDDTLCAVTLASGEREHRMVCHRADNVCVLPCAGDNDCPAAWVCDDRASTTGPAGTALCVNPTCDADP